MEACAEQMRFATPEELDGSRVPDRDSLLLTMDDGDARTYRAVEWLASVGIRIIYFVVPSYVGRTATQYLAYHRARGVEAFNIASGPDRGAARGFARSQLEEMERMGHRIGAHNDAHRNLARLDEGEASYEIEGAIGRLSDLLGHPVDDFAWAFGTVTAISPHALALMRARCRRVYSCVRGPNVPGISPAIILRDIVSVEAPRLFTRARLAGGFDHRHERERRALLAWSGRLQCADGRSAEDALVAGSAAPPIVTQRMDADGHAVDS